MLNTSTHLFLRYHFVPRGAAENRTNQVSMAPRKNQKIAKACRELKRVGISANEVKGAIKELLAVYKNKWAFIEDDNYRALLDFILEKQEKEKLADRKIWLHAVSEEEDEDPSLMLIRRRLKRQASTSVVESPSLRSQQQVKTVVTETDSLGVINQAQYEVPLAVEYPEMVPNQNSSSNQKGFGVVETRPPHVDDSLPKASQFDIASSSEGDVKISLICNFPRPNFKFPCFDKVLKTVEAICIKPDTTTAPMLDMKLMKEICECAFALGTGSAYGKKPSTQAIYVVDITRGEERVKISLVNDCSDLHLVLPSFHYVRENTVYRRADVSFALVHILDEDCCSDCLGDCLSSGRSCACAGGTGGGFAYTSSGILNELFLEECIATNREEIKKGDFSSPCKIHSLAKFIKECWVKCGCTKKCGNRVVQRGITAKLQVFMTSREKGWGLRTLEDLPKGAFVCEYAGEVLTKSELRGRRIEKQRSYSVLLGASWGSDNNVLMDEHALHLDSTNFGNAARFINHRCFDASLIAIPVEIESPDRRYYHLGLFATRKIKAMEELTWDYGVSFDEFKCLCGSAHCRGSKVYEV